MTSCTKTAPATHPPEGFTVEQAREHPGFRWLLDPGAKCELDAGHGDGTAEDDVARRHRSGLLVWWDPPLLVIGATP